ncbi:MAG: OadG family protein [Kiritimatiellae bacterium]|nr:OadG family protein [Kiritimatiellia bacterium]
MSVFAQSLSLLVMGMSVVMVFLALMVLMVQAMSAFFRAHADRFADPAPVTPVAKAMQDFAHVAVAIAAVRARCQK